MISDMTERPFVKGIHCSAHRFELAYKDGTKDIPIHKKCELLLLNLYLFYKYSSLNRANLKIAFDSIGKKMLVPTRVGGTRWLPHTERALKHVITGYDGIVLHLEQMQQNPSKESSAKARNFLKLLKDKSVILWLHFMMDVVKSLGAVSMKIQDQQSTIADIYSELDSAKAILNKFKRSACNSNLFT
ncbi:zinc finger protein 862-like [Saccostrea echinata]|uniref:zinc finger protein 862-like n=1 Tax=Saccostrea echinata TaxID=191078 RepID=UPI002A814377|nr:zinc finger protein 862-like [Saccostrea echinata]